MSPSTSRLTEPGLARSPAARSANIQPLKPHSARTRPGQRHDAPCKHCVAGPGVPFARLPARTCKTRLAHGVPDLTPTQRGPEGEVRNSRLKHKQAGGRTTGSSTQTQQGTNTEPHGSAGTRPRPGPGSGPSAGSADPCGRSGEPLVRRCQVKAGDLAGSQRLPFSTGKDAGNCSLCPVHARRRRLARTRRLPPRSGAWRCCQ